MKAFSLVAAIACTLTLATSAGATPRPAWSLAQANKKAADAVVPYCQISAASQDCVNGVSTAKFVPHSATCKGIARSVIAGKFWRFSCELYAVNDFHAGTLEMTVTGAATFRWKFAKPS